jgi:hypothetical protein
MWLTFYLLLVAPANTAEPVTELGTLTPFYRGTQLQGHLVGMGLIEIPSYLTEDVDLKYQQKAGVKEEIPFVDTFSIARFLGGYREDWLKKFNLWDERLGKRSLDYVTRGSSGALEFHPDLIKRRLAPYLDAGYRPQDIEIGLENVPWDLARSADSSRGMGIWGQKEPPADLNDWQVTLSHFANDLSSILGSAASLVRFKTGGEYDEKASFDGSAQDFFAYYAATDAGLHRVLPDAALSPGEFTGGGTCEPGRTTCVYDSRDFLEFAASHRLRVSSAPRSLHSFLDRPNAMPSATVNRAVASYARLSGTRPEILQFGLLDEPFGAQDGDDPAALQANWEFQTLVGLWQRLKPFRVFHWGGVISMGRLTFLNGSGYLRLVLDRYVGSRAYRLNAIRDVTPSPETEVAAVAFINGKTAALVISSFSAKPAATTREVTVELPAFLANMPRPPKTLQYRESDNVFVAVRRDLEKEGNLKPELKDCAWCLAVPLAMATDVDRARQMIARQWPRYVEIMKKELRWNDDPPHLSVQGARLTIDLEGNELVLAEW